MNLNLDATHENADEQAAACARLLTRTITQAIIDACAPLSNEEATHEVNLNQSAVENVEWLFDPYGVFNLYADLIGSDAQSIRRAIMSTVTLRDGPQFGELQRTALHRRVRNGGCKHAINWAIENDWPL